MFAQRVFVIVKALSFSFIYYDETNDNSHTSTFWNTYMPCERHFWCFSLDVRRKE